MAGKQVLRIETRERLKLGNARHVAGLARDATARPVPEPVVALGGGGLRRGAQGPARPWSSSLRGRRPTTGAGGAVAARAGAGLGARRP